MLLRRDRGGDSSALGDLTERDLPWIRPRVEARPGAASGKTALSAAARRTVAQGAALLGSQRRR